jgi:hypothetical protein
MDQYRFYLDEWLPQCPLEERDYGGYSAEIITGPHDICNNEHLRRATADQIDWGPPVPVDVFVMAEGEPPDRHITKIGGLPYRSSTAPWPTVADGTEMLSLTPYKNYDPRVAVDTERPMSFVGQVNFSNSKDLAGPLPGDLLLIFASDGFESIYLEWQSLGLEDLVLPDQMSGLPGFDPCYGYACRTVSYPKAVLTDDLTFQGSRVDSSYLLPRYQATQIGEAPFFVQQYLSDKPYRPLCTINSVGPNPHGHHPWINRDAPLLPKGEWGFSSNYLGIVDGGCIYVLTDQEGQYRWACDYY